MTHQVPMTHQPLTWGRDPVMSPCTSAPCQAPAWPHCPHPTTPIPPGPWPYPLPPPPPSARGKSRLSTKGGVQMWGLLNPTIAQLIAELPGADKLPSYGNVTPEVQATTAAAAAGAAAAPRKKKAKPCAPSPYPGDGLLQSGAALREPVSAALKRQSGAAAGPFEGGGRSSTGPSKRAGGAAKHASAPGQELDLDDMCAGMESDPGVDPRAAVSGAKKRGTSKPKPAKPPPCPAYLSLASEAQRGGPGPGPDGLVPHPSDLLAEMQQRAAAEALGAGGREQGR